MKKNYLVAALLLISTLFVGVGCNNSDDAGQGSGGAPIIEKPLELPWLKAEIDELTLAAQESSTPLTALIYQCVYGNNEAGFLIVKDDRQLFYDRNGKIVSQLIEPYTGETWAEFWPKLHVVSKAFLLEITTPCEFENPLTDLSWLKTLIDELFLAIQHQSVYVSVPIYQCVYENGKIGFLIDEGNTKDFYNCNGKLLGRLGGVAGATLPEYNIDFKTKKLILEINNEDLKR